jgi:hypothetical protein
MGRLDTRMHRAPVQIGLSQARVQQAGMLLEDGVLDVARGAGNYGQKERRFSSVPIRLRIQANAGPNSAIGIDGTKAIGHTKRKRGYPAIVTLPTVPQAGK